MKIHEIYNLRDQKLKEIGFGSYQEYLLSNEWKNIKDKVRNRASRKWKFCNICGCSENLDLHHSSYKVIGLKDPGNTIKPLCRVCHNELHQLSKVNPEWSFYKTCGKIRSKRKKLGKPLFVY